MIEVTTDEVKTIKETIERGLHISVLSQDTVDPTHQGVLTAEVPFDLVVQIIAAIRGMKQ